MTTNFSVRGIHHVQLAMPQGGEQDAVDFYTGLLGFTQIPKPAHLQARGGCWFQLEQIQFHLGVEEPFTPARKAHPALTVTDLPALQERLEQAEVEIVWDTQLDGHRRFYTHDCFGNRLELIEAVPTGEGD